MPRLEINLNNSEIISGDINIFVPTYYNNWTDAIDLYYSNKEYTIPVTEDLSFLKKKSRIYFHSNSDFPRFKLQTNNFINARTTDKIDLAVIAKDSNKLGRDSYDDYIVCEANNCFYLMREAQTKYMFYDSNHNYIKSDSNCDEIINWLIQNNRIPSSAKIIYNGPLRIYNNSEIEFYKSFQNVPYPVTTDYLLDLHISKSLELLNQESLSEIKELLSSPDMGIKGAALKMIAASNYYTNKYQVKYLLSTFEDLTLCPEWNSVSCKYMRSALQINLNGYFNPLSLYDLSKVFDKSLGAPSDEDEIFMRTKLLAAIRKQLDDCGISISQQLDNIILKDSIKLHLDTE